MKTGMFALAALLLFFGDSATAKEVNEGMCTSYLNMYCTRCHATERICADLGNNDGKRWREVITEMADYDNLDQDVQDTAHACLTGMKPGDSIVCKKK